MYKYQKTILENGFKTIGIPMNQTRTISVLYAIKVGSRYEDKRINGLSHFVEHMMFKGTPKYPNTQDISNALDGIGAEFNAFTSEEFTCYYIKAPDQHFEFALDMLTDMVFNSLIPNEEIEREKGVIVAEIKMYNDDPKGLTDIISKQTIFGDTPLGRNIAGSVETVSKFTRKDFINYHQKFYHSKNSIFSAAGNLPKNWQKIVRQKISQISAKRILPYEKNIDKQKKPQVALAYKKNEQTSLAISFRIFSRYDDRSPILSVLNKILGGLMSSRLFITVRERNGLAYYISSHLEMMHDTGCLTVYAGVHPDQIEKAINLIMFEIERMKKELVTDEELNKAKENICGRMYLNMEESMDVANYFAIEMGLYKKIELPDEKCEKIRKVTAEDIQKLANVIFDFNKVNLTIVGPHKSKAGFEKLLS